MNFFFSVVGEIELIIFIKKRAELWLHLRFLFLLRSVAKRGLLVVIFEM